MIGYTTFGSMVAFEVENPDGNKFNFHCFT